MNLTIILCFFLLLSSCFSLAFSEHELDELTDTFKETLSEGIDDSIDKEVDDPRMQCVQKLLPCQPYLHGSSQPPAVCCYPLKEMVVNETQCLCSVMDNPGILKSLNITQNDALNLAKACGAKADLSVCKNATSPPGSPATPAPPTPASPSGKNTAAYGMSRFGGSDFLAIFVGLIIVSMI